MAPLDWGLGHATRCIPVIRELIIRNAEVLLAAEGQQAALLQKEFPGLHLLSLPGYNIRYAKSAAGLSGKILIQFPRVSRTIKQEHEWLQSVVKEHSIDAVISDNRFGLHHSAVPCIFITHQLTIKNPFGKWGGYILQRWNYKHINQFSECWVPDYNEENNLAGLLSHPEKMPLPPVHYIGPLSRLTVKETAVKKNHLLVLLSGPEPQRSLLENKLINQLAHYNGTAAVVRGLPSANSLIPSTNQIIFHNHLPADELATEIAQAEWVICRSGYSSIMDFIQLRKKMILIPTPGQPEQEYLAKWLSQKKLAISFTQKEFRLEKALQAAQSFSWQYFPGNPGNMLQERITHFLNLTGCKNL